MIRWLSALVVTALAVAGAMVLALPARTIAQTTAAPAIMTGAQERQILVMVRLTPDHLKPNAGYGGSYGDRLTSTLRRGLAERIARESGLNLVGEGWPMALLGVDCYVMSVREGEPVEAAVARVSRDPRVAWSEPLHLYQTRARDIPINDPLFPAQPAAQAWRLADLHHTATGRGVVIAVIDSRIELSHPDLAGQFVANADFVAGQPGGAERHGTGVAGVIAAKAGNGVGIVGIAPGARLMALRACWQTAGDPGSAPTLCDSLSLARAISFAIEHRAQIINLSLAGPPDRLLKLLVDAATSQNISVVAAYDPALPNGGFPASEPAVIAVSDEISSPFPTGVYRAPGRDIPTTQPGGKWFLVSGSSYAAAHVSGLIALVREVHPSALRTLLVADRSAGGAIDACATLSRAAGACPCPSCPGDPPPLLSGH